MVRPEEVLQWLYALFHSPEYRKRFSTSLASSFPVVLLPATRAAFNALSNLGAQLVAWHLLERESGRATDSSAIVDIRPLSNPHPHPRARDATSPVWIGADRSLQKVAEKGRELAELTAVDSSSSPTNDAARTDENGTDAAAALGLETTGKVFINATSGFANVRVGVWKHTIGGYQVLHKWLDDRRKAGRSLTDEDITHWLRVYAALEAT